jgi:DNA-binding transcriptional MerR regulator/methylmalonyl-CoA mutase cobalamin-binding subunit
MNYSVAAVSRLTQLSADVIRVWERRYAIVAPLRDGGGARRYSNDDVERLRLAAVATTLGHPIRSLAGLSTAALADLVGARPVPSNGASSARLLDKIVRAIRKSDAVAAERTVAAAVRLLPTRELVLTVLAPALRQIGEAWACGRASLWQEHLLSTLVRDATELAALAPGAPAMVFVTPPFESHGFGNLFAAMLASARGVRAVNLGIEVPACEAVAAVAALKADVLVCSMLGAAGRPSQALSYVTEVASMLDPKATVVLGGPLGVSIASSLGSPRVRADGTLEEFDAFVEAWCKARRSGSKKSQARAPVAQLDRAGDS